LIQITFVIKHLSSPEFNLFPLIYGKKSTVIFSYSKKNGFIPKAGAFVTFYFYLFVEETYLGK